MILTAAAAAVAASAAGIYHLPNRPPWRYSRFAILSSPMMMLLLLVVSVLVVIVCVVRLAISLIWAFFILFSLSFVVSIELSISLSHAPEPPIQVNRMKCNYWREK